MSPERELAGLILDWLESVREVAAIYPALAAEPVMVRAQLDQLEALGREGPPLGDYTDQEWSAWQVAVALHDLAAHDAPDGAQ